MFGDAESAQSQVYTSSTRPNHIRAASNQLKADRHGTRRSRQRVVGGNADKSDTRAGAAATGVRGAKIAKLCISLLDIVDHVCHMGSEAHLCPSDDPRRLVTKDFRTQLERLTNLINRGFTDIINSQINCE